MAIKATPSRILISLHLDILQESVMNGWCFYKDDIEFKYDIILFYQNSEFCTIKHELQESCNNKTLCGEELDGGNFLLKN